MFKKIIFINVLLILASCSDEFVTDDAQPSGTITAEQVFSSASGVDAFMTGIYANMRDFGLVGESGNARSTDAALEKHVYLGWDVMGRDMQVSSFNWYIFEHRWDVTSSDRARRTFFMWDLYYQTIFGANNVIAFVPEMESISETQKSEYIAEARALRAYSLFQLIRAYQFTYAKNPSLPGVPVVTEPYDPSTSTGQPRGTMEETYAQIIEDLEYASANIPTARGSKVRFNYNVVEAIKARVYLEMQEYELALAAARNARAGFPLMSASEYLSGFNDVNNPEWIWGYPLNADENHGFFSFYSHNDHRRAQGYQQIYLSQDFVNLFTSGSDVRSSLIQSTGSSTFGQEFVTIKFTDLPDLSGDYVMIRSAEMYLIEAECLARLNPSNLDLAKQTLFTLQSSRDPNAVLSSASDLDTLIEEILVERRKELYGEIGVDWLDLKRLEKSFDRTGGNYVWPKSVSADSNEWNFLIPEDEINSNENISPADQNPL